MYDDESESLSNNSELFSSSSFGHSLSGSQQLLKPNRIFRSQRIQSESEDDSSEGEGGLLYKSAESLRKAANRVREEVQITEMRMEGSVGSKSSQSSNREDNRMCRFVAMQTCSGRSHGRCGCIRLAS
jgi:hypothetical protein